MPRFSNRGRIAPEHRSSKTSPPCDPSVLTTNIIAVRLIRYQQQHCRRAINASSSLRHRRQHHRRVIAVSS
jgi:hypothetical protein